MIRRWSVALLGVLLAALGACTVDPSQPTTPTTLRIAAAEAGCTIAPMGMTGLSMVSYGMAELLVRPLPDGTVEPWLAESFTQLRPDQWQFRLRDGIQFHNGRTVDAEAAVAALRYAAEQSFAADPVSTGTVEVTGAREFTLTTTQPFALTPNALASIYSYPIFDADAAAAAPAGSDEAALVAAGVYTGPFRPTAVTGQAIIAERFDGYWGARPAVPGIELRCVPDAQARVAAVRSGESDLAFSPPPGVREALGEEPRARYVSSSVASEATFLQLNTAQPPFDELPVRQAFVLGIDYQALSQDRGVNGLLADGLYPAGLPGTATTQRTDRPAAERLLDGAGWVPDAGGARRRGGEQLVVTYLWSDDPSHESIGILLRDQLAPLGFDVQLRQVEAHYDDASWPENWAVNANPMTMEGLGNDPTQVLNDWLGPGGSNFGQVEDARLYELIGQAREHTDPSARADLLREAQDVTWRQGFAVVATFRPVEAVVGPGYQDFRPDSKLIHIRPELAQSS